MGGGKAVCPICGAEEVEASIEEHVNRCLDGTAAVAPQQQSSSAVPAAVPIATTTKVEAEDQPLLKRNKNSPLVLSDDNNVKEENKRILAALEEKHKQEEADRLLAEKLQRELALLESNSNVASTTSVTQLPTKHVTFEVEDTLVDDMKNDLELAKKLEEEERERIRKETEENDRLFAELLAAEDRERREAEAKAAKERELRDKKIAEEIERKAREEQREREKRDGELAMQLIRNQMEADRIREEAQRFDQTVSLFKDEITHIEQEKERIAKAKARIESEKARLEREVAELRRKTMVLESSIAEDVEYPYYWADQYSDYETYEVFVGSPEWERISGAFYRGRPNSNYVINTIKRVQNKRLYKWYSMKKADLMKKNEGFCNEKWAFHGSRTNAYYTIAEEGFDHRVANLNGANGAGIYFSESSSVSLSYISQLTLLYCRVLAGHVGPGSSGLRRPPKRSNGQLFDSVSGNEMLVIFDNYQAYPEYIITLRNRYY